MLFVPVSGPYGRGEYARSLAIASAASERWPGADIHFVLSRQAPYAASVPFPATLLASSPTFHTAAVNALIEERRPHVVIFDNAGRTAQLRAATRAGARVIYISARSRQRRKAFRWRWMRLLDEHWIAYPKFIAGPPNALERLKLKLLKRPVLRYLDVIMSRAPAAEASSISARMDLSKGYVLIVPGGGTGHPQAQGANAAFFAAASAVAMGGFVTLYVGPAVSSSATALLHCVESLPQSQLVQLMREARLVICNGGSTLLQAIACGAACVAAPIAKDQQQRIARCVSAGVALASTLDAAAMTRSAQTLLNDEARRAALKQGAARLGLADGIEIALASLNRLLESV